MSIVGFAQARAANAVIAGAASNDLLIYTATSNQKVLVGSSNAAAPLLTIAGNGNVGIGTNNPAYKLDVAGQVQVANTISYSSSDPGDMIVKTYGGANRYGFGQYTNGSVRAFFASSFSNATFSVSRTTADPNVFTDFLTVNTAGMVRMTAGPLYIQNGVSTPPTLSVLGGSGSRVVLWEGGAGASTTPYALGIESSTMWFSSGAGNFKFYNGSAANTVLIDGAGNFNCTGNITAYYSDARLKEDLRRIEDSGDVIDSLTGYRYRWNEVGRRLTLRDSETVEIGLIAQDVQRVVPQAVSVNKANQKEGEAEEYLTIHYDKLVPFLVEAVKDLRARVASLEADKAGLEARLAALEK